MRVENELQLLRKIPILLIITVFAVFVLSISPAEASIIYVNVSAAGANNGTSWTNAYSDLQSAFSATESGDEIWVAAGTYKPSAEVGGSGDRYKAFQLKTGVGVYGGFSGIETGRNQQRYQRDWQANKTIVSGDLNGDDNDNIDVDEPTRQDNCYHVFYHPQGTNLNRTAILDGFVITSGNANYNWDADCGGGMYSYSCNPTVINCTFIENSSVCGGGMYNDSSHPTLDNCKFIRNTSDMGGGIFNSNSTSYIINCMFIGNSAYCGGGINNQYTNGTTVLINCTFTGNKAFNNGGGICIEYINHLIIINCTFGRNNAFMGNALYCNRNNYRNASRGFIDLNNCIFWDGGNEIYNENGSYIFIAYSNVQYGQTAIFDPDKTVIWGKGNINVDPLFVDADGYDDIFDTEDDNFRLLEDSPCIDAGSNSALPWEYVADIDGNRRIINGIIDMGAYESPGTLFLLSTRSLIVPEEGAVTFQVALAEAPSQILEVIVVHYSGDQDITVQSGGLLTFDALNYSVPQTVTLAAAEDSDNLNSTAQIWVTAAGGLKSVVTATEADNEPYVGVLFVDEDAIGNDNGSNWMDAYHNLQDALSVAKAGRGVEEIRVAQGIYRPDQGDSNIIGDRTSTFQLINGVIIKGGYAGYDEPDPNIRDIGTYETILSGDLNGDDVDTADPCDLFLEPTRGENCYHVVTSVGTDTACVLDGFTITGGNANGDYQLLYQGGGIYNQNLWYTDYEGPTIVYCKITKNSAGGEGGGMYNQYSRQPKIISCVFVNNMALWGGGGMKNDESHPAIRNCLFENNFAGGDVYNSSIGGGIDNEGSSPKLTNCFFIGNTAGHGGAVSNCWCDCNPMFVNCVFSKNSAQYGGGLCISNYHEENSNPNLINCTFFGNIADYGNALATGWISDWDSRPSNIKLANCIIWDGGNEISNGDESIIEVAYSNIQNGQNSVLDPCEFVVWSEGNIDTDPLFAYAHNGEFRLLIGSPCIDAGSNSALPPGYVTDIDGNRRIINDVIDMGAYEYGTEPLPLEIYDLKFLWGTTFGDVGSDTVTSLDQTSDGGYIFAGYTNSKGAGGYDVYIVKTDYYGNVEWERTHGGNENDYGRSIQQTLDGGYIIGGTTYSFGAGSSEGYLIKTNSIGAAEWYKTYGGIRADEFYSVQQTSDHGFILAGKTESLGYGSSDVFVIKTDSSGRMLWKKFFGGTDIDSASSVQETTDHGFIVCGTTSSFNNNGFSDFYLVRTNSEGQLLWQRTFGTEWSDEASCAKQTADGGFIITGTLRAYSTGSNAWDIGLIKTDKDGNLKWLKQFGGTGRDIGKSVQRTSDGGYIILAETNSYGAGNGDMYLIKTNPDGIKDWDMIFGTPATEQSSAIQTTPEGGYIIAGTTNYFGAGNEDFYIIRLGNFRPVANAGEDQTVYTNNNGVAEVYLDASYSYDPEGDALTYRWYWTIDGRPYETNLMSPTIILPIGQYSIRLTVNDGRQDSFIDEVIIDVIGNVESNLER